MTRSAILFLLFVCFSISSGENEQVFFGNLHSHTSFSDGAGTPQDAYRYARFTAHLHFLAVTDHNHMLAKNYEIIGNSPVEMTAAAVASYSSNVVAEGENPGASPRWFFWVCAGLGGTTTGYGLGLAASYQHDRHLFSMRYSNGEEARMTTKARKDIDWDIALLYGRVIRSPHVAFALALGPAVVGGNRAIPYHIPAVYSDRDSFGPILGLAIEGQAVYSVTAFFGVSLYTFADFNQERLHAGLLVTLVFGKLKWGG